MGVHVEIKAGRPRALVVVADEEDGVRTVIEEFSCSTAANQADSEQIADIASAIRTRISGLRPDVVVVRRAELAKVASSRSGPQLRLLCEGAVTHAAMLELNRVILFNGRDLAQQAGVASRGDLDSEGSALIDDADYLRAAGACVAGFKIAPS